MTIFQLQKRVRRAKNIIRRSEQAAQRNDNKDEINAAKGLELDQKIAQARLFLNRVVQWQEGRKNIKPFRCALPLKKQRALGLI